MTANSNHDANVVKRPAPRADGPQHDSTPPAALPAAQSAPHAPELPSESDHVRHRDAGPPVSALPWLIGGVCAGMLGVCVLALILFGSRNRESVANVDDPRQQPINNIAKANQRDAAEQRRRDALRAKLDNDRLLASRVAPTTAAPDPLTWDRDPAIETGGDLLEVDDLDKPVVTPRRDAGSSTVDVPEDSSTTAQPVARLAALPRAVTLPRPASSSDAPISTSPYVLTRVEIDQPRDVQLQLVNNQLAGGSGRFELTPRDVDDDTRVWDVEHVADGEEAKSIGQYSLADGELSFAWSPEADASDKGIAQLENQPLRITAGEETTTIAQRAATEIAPLVVKVDAGAIGVSTVIENPPEHANVMVVIDELGDDFGEYVWEPSSTIEVGKSTDLRFGTDADKFQFALHITAEETSPGKVRIESRPMFRQGNTRKWDYFRPKETGQALGSLRQQQSVLDAQMQQVQQRYRRNPTALAQANAVHNQQSALLLEQIANLERISDQCQALQDKAELHFRIYAQSGDEQIDLVRTKSDASAQEEPPMPPDENIGAPIDPSIGPPDEAP